MLPPTVAISLQQKKQVAAETYESVTVYFSDIADFLTLGFTILDLELIWVWQVMSALSYFDMWNLLWSINSRKYPYGGCYTS